MKYAACTPMSNRLASLRRRRGIKTAEVSKAELKRVLQKHEDRETPAQEAAESKEEQRIEEQAGMHEKKAFLLGFCKQAEPKSHYLRRFALGNPLSASMDASEERKGLAYSDALAHAHSQALKGLGAGTLGGLGAGAFSKLRGGGKGLLVPALAGAALGTVGGVLRGHLGSKATEIHKRHSKDNIDVGDVQQYKTAFWHGFTKCALSKALLRRAANKAHKEHLHMIDALNQRGAPLVRPAGIKGRAKEPVNKINEALRDAASKRKRQWRKFDSYEHQKRKGFDAPALAKIPIVQKALKKQKSAKITGA